MKTNGRDEDEKERKKEIKRHVIIKNGKIAIAL